MTPYAGYGPCPTCHAPVWTGLDLPVLARWATADPAPLTPAGEAAALLDGRGTVELARTRDGAELVRRDPARITSRPAGHPATVLADHRCHRPVPPAWTVPPAPAPRRPAGTQEPPW